MYYIHIQSCHVIMRGQYHTNEESIWRAERAKQLTRALTQMIARCRKVGDQTIIVLNNQMVQINDNHNFWTFRDEYATNKSTIHGQPFTAEWGRLKLGSSHDERQKILSIRNTVAMLYKHPSLYLNLLKLLEESKCMQLAKKEPLAKGEFISSRDRETN